MDAQDPVAKMFEAEAARLKVAAEALVHRFGQQGKDVMLTLTGAHIDLQCIVGMAIDHCGRVDDPKVLICKSLTERVQNRWAERAIGLMFPDTTPEAETERSAFIAEMHKETANCNSMLEAAQAVQLALMAPATAH